jgi:hypothetical protein
MTQRAISGRPYSPADINDKEMCSELYLRVKHEVEGSIEFLRQGGYLNQSLGGFI